MILTLKLTSHQAAIALSERAEGQPIAQRIFEVDNNLSQNLLAQIQTMLDDANQELGAISSIEFVSQDAGFTTSRIGEATVNALRFGLDISS